MEPSKIRHRYNLQQKKRAVAMVKSKSVQAAATYYRIPRTMINRWMVDGYFNVKWTKKGNNNLDQDFDMVLLTWLLEAHDKHLPMSRMIFKAKELELITPTCPLFQV